jgi:hypothetical protein
MARQLQVSLGLAVYCVWIGMHEWLIALVVQRSGSPFLPLARFGPTHRRAFGIPAGEIYLRARIELKLLLNNGT